MESEYLDEDEMVIVADILIASAIRLGYGQAASILKMARLDLLAQQHGITTKELKAFAEALAKKSDSALAGQRPIRELYGEARSRTKTRRVRLVRKTRRS